MPDLRTRAGREHEVLHEIQKAGGFTVFWGTDNQKRAGAIDRLVQRGRIRRLEGGSYPWCRFEVVRRSEVSDG